MSACSFLWNFVACLAQARSKKLNRTRTKVSVELFGRVPDTVYHVCGTSSDVSQKGLTRNETERIQKFPWNFLWRVPEAAYKRISELTLKIFAGCEAGCWGNKLHTVPFVVFSGCVSVNKQLSFMLFCAKKAWLCKVWTWFSCPHERMISLTLRLVLCVSSLLLWLPCHTWAQLKELRTPPQKNRIFRFFLHTLGFHLACMTCLPALLSETAIKWKTIEISSTHNPMQIFHIP